MIKASKLRKSYVDGSRQITVIDGLDLTIEAGQTVALMGQSGSGKSTLLHLLGGFDSTDEGQIVIGDTDITDLDDAALSTFRRRQLGMIFQQYNLIPSLTAKDNLTFVRRLNGLPAMDTDTERLIEVLGLADRLDHFPAQLSGGEQQRVAIGRALAAKPSVILADEPTGNLDEQTAKRVMDLLVEAVALNQVTMLMVTHSPTTAEHLQQVWHLENGALRC